MPDEPYYRRSPLERKLDDLHQRSEELRREGQRLEELHRLERRVPAEWLTFMRRLGRADWDYPTC
jgi:hypothetical protein